jgi:uncharacterized protein YdeI (YjbR/CyaY-like superfamily)
MVTALDVGVEAPALLLVFGAERRGYSYLGAMATLRRLFLPRARQTRQKWPISSGASLPPNLEMKTSMAPSVAPASPDGKPVLGFASASTFERWLARNHANQSGIWLRIFKKDSGRSTVTYAEALDAALCYGWIDGQRKRGDTDSFLQRFTPRGKRSAWSKINTGHVERLTLEGRMKPAGLAVVEAAKKDGRWDAAYSAWGAFEMPAEFTGALAESPKAAEFFTTLNTRNRYAIFYRLITAKRPETKACRLRKFITMLEHGEKLY